MNKVTLNSRKRRFRVPYKLAKSNSAKTENSVVITYACPQHPNDVKRWGRQMGISMANSSMTLDGRGIRSLKCLLRDVGELDQDGRFNSPLKTMAASWTQRKNGISMVYCCPERPNDLKREGRNLTIYTKNSSMTLDGRAIRSIKCLLRDVGELEQI